MKACSVLLAGSAMSIALAELTTIGTTVFEIPTPVPQKSPVCNADNCARAVTGTALGHVTRAAHQADCSSFLSCTGTITLGAPDSVAVTCPTAVPSYARACSGSARFRSACECAGATHTTNFVTYTPSSVWQPYQS